VTVRVERQEVEEGLHSGDDSGDGIILWDCLLKKGFQRIPGATAEIGEEFPIIEKILAQDLRDAEHEVPVLPRICRSARRNLLDARGCSLVTCI
jgi:hypothetical protein